MPGPTDGAGPLSRDEVALGVVQLVAGGPTLVSIVALGWFLRTVPVPPPTWRRALGAVFLSPVFLVLGVLAFLFSVGLGSVVFALLLWWQGTRPAPASL